MRVQNQGKGQVLLYKATFTIFGWSETLALKTCCFFKDVAFGD